MMEALFAGGSEAGRDCQESGSASSRSLMSILCATCDMIGLWIERHRQRRDLMSLPDHMLGDIGISRSDAFQEYTKPFWKI
jgi:uncharacterized protein YjiS (DUF1127 family)